MTRKIQVGNIAIGGGAPVSVQSMTNTRTDDVEATLAQIRRMKADGCQIVRVAVPDMAAAMAIEQIKKGIDIPLVADIHFDYRLAIAAVEAGADKIRINPGNIGAPERVKLVAEACRKAGIPIRVGVNGGSLEKEVLEKYGGVTPQALVESAMGQIALLNRFDFDDICVSIKSSDVRLTVEAYRLFAAQADYPLHIGVTEAGTEYMGIMKSAAGIGALLLDGIGDTIRVSLTAAPERECVAGDALLRAIGLRKGVNVISCPSCGRCRYDQIGAANMVEQALKDLDADISVAVMGCVVNGPGEARHADFGIAGGEGKGVLFKKGEIVATVPSQDLAKTLIDTVRKEYSGRNS